MHTPILKVCNALEGATNDCSINHYMYLCWVYWAQHLALALHGRMVVMWSSPFSQNKDRCLWGRSSIVWNSRCRDIPYIRVVLPSNSCLDGFSFNTIDCNCNWTKWPPRRPSSITIEKVPQKNTIRILFKMWMMFLFLIVYFYTLLVWNLLIFVSYYYFVPLKVYIF